MGFRDRVCVFFIVTQEAIRRMTLSGLLSSSQSWEAQNALNELKSKRRISNEVTYTWGKSVG